MHLLKYSFQAVDHTWSIPTKLFDVGYIYFSFGVTSLFTNVITINTILRKIYKHNLVKTNVKRSILKKLIKNSYTKTAFSCDGKIYKQIDGVLIGSSLGSVLTNVKKTELERIVVVKLIRDGSFPTIFT